MYRPEVFALTDKTLIAQAMGRHDFALLVTAPGARRGPATCPSSSIRARAIMAP